MKLSLTLLLTFLFSVLVAAKPAPESAEDKKPSVQPVGKWVKPEDARPALAASKKAKDPSPVCEFIHPSVPCRSCPCKDCPIVIYYKFYPTPTFTCWLGGSTENQVSYWDRTIDGCWVNEYYISDGCWTNFLACHVTVRVLKEYIP